LAHRPTEVIIRPTLHAFGKFWSIPAIFGEIRQNSFNSAIFGEKFEIRTGDHGTGRFTWFPKLSHEFTRFHMNSHHFKKNKNRQDGEDATSDARRAHPIGI
jgi:hypothetical protein